MRNTNVVPEEIALLFVINTGSVYFRVKRMSCFASEISDEKSMCKLIILLTHICMFKTVISNLFDKIVHIFVLINVKLDQINTERRVFREAYISRLRAISRKMAISSRSNTIHHQPHRTTGGNLRTSRSHNFAKWGKLRLYLLFGTSLKAGMGLHPFYDCPIAPANPLVSCWGCALQQLTNKLPLVLMSTPTIRSIVTVSM